MGNKYFVAADVNGRTRYWSEAERGWFDTDDKLRFTSYSDEFTASEKADELKSVIKSDKVKNIRFVKEQTYIIKNVFSHFVQGKNL